MMKDKMKIIPEVVDTDVVRAYDMYARVYVYIICTYKKNVTRHSKGQKAQFLYPTHGRIMYIFFCTLQ